jgi:hypothetical protein
MKLKSLIARLRPRTGARRSAAATVTLSLRDWADLPVYHPLRRD